MANKRKDMQLIKQIYRLHTQGVSKSQISKRLLISRNTVKKYIELFEKHNYTTEKLNELDDSTLSVFLKQQEKSDSPRLEQLKALFPYFEKELRKTGVTKQLLWEEYKSKYSDGYQSSQFCFHYDEWKRQSAVVMHFEHKAADKLFIDFTGKKLYITDRETGELIACEVFVGVLGSSQYTYVQACRTQNKEDFLSCIENALHHFGGVPRAIVSDNLKSAVTKSSKYEPTLNETFLDFASHYQTSILPTRAYKPKDKALVENSVRIMYSRIFAPLRKEVFLSIEDLNEAVLSLLEQHNKKHFQGRRYSRFDLFKEVEEQELSPLPTRKYELKAYAYVTVHKNAHIYLSKDKHYYSVPYPLIGKKVRIIYSSDQIDIYYKQEPVTSHKRDYRLHRYSTQKQHMPSQHQFVAEWNPDKFINWAEDIGEACRVYIIRVLQRSQHPEQNYKSCLGVLSLAKKVGKERLENACKRGADYDVFNYRIIQNILEKGLDQLEEKDDDKQSQIPPHQNIRGKNYYQ